MSILLRNIKRIIGCDIIKKNHVLKTFMSKSQLVLMHDYVKNELIGNDTLNYKIIESLKYYEYEEYVYDNFFRNKMTESELKISDLGEKILIKYLIKPLFNETKDKNLAGDDCAILNIKDYTTVSVSTDRVPSDLIAFRLGLMEYFDLGYYLAVLNISDIYASGHEPVGLLLNFGLNNDMKVKDLYSCLKGVKRACIEYRCIVMGGDLSSSKELSISATSLGVNRAGKPLYRSNSKVGDLVFISKEMGKPAAAFAYYLRAKKRGLSLNHQEEEILKSQLCSPKVDVMLSKALSQCTSELSCMDNTDGIGQSFIEIAEINDVKIILDEEKFLIPDIVEKVAVFLKEEPNLLSLSACADFQLIGTISKENYNLHEELLVNKIQIIGEVTEGRGVFLRKDFEVREYTDQGWDYFNEEIDRLLEKV
ncbi:thiamine-phosphate kinase [Mycoplasmatota bacterium WC44]